MPRFLSCALLALLCVPLLWLAPARADDRSILTLQDVLARDLQAIGGPKAAAIPATERITATLERGGLTGTDITLTKGMSAQWEQVKIGLQDDTSGTDGKLFWERDANGTVRLLSSEELKDEKTSLYLSAYSYLFSDRMPGKVMLRPQTEKRTGNYVVDCVPDGGKACALFFDPKSFLLVKEQQEEDDLTNTTTFADFKQMGSGLVATTIRSSDGDKKYDDVTHITAIDEGVEAPDALFALPPSPKNWEWDDPKAASDAVPSATVPFNYADHDINLYVAINGEPAYLVLDSGDSDLTLSRQAADYLKLKRSEQLEGRGYGGSTNIYPVKMAGFDLVGGVNFQNLTATTIDLPEGFDFGAATPTVGFGGYNLLSRFIVQIDYTAQHLVLYDPNTWTPTPADGTPLPMELEDNVPSVLASFDGLPPARFLLDTGDAASVVRLYSPYVSQNKLVDKYPRGMDVYGMGVGGESKARRVRAQLFSIAGITLQSVPTDFALDKKGGASKVLAGALGDDFLARFTVTFDYPHQRIFFAPNARARQPFDTRDYGVEVIQHPEDIGLAKRRLLIVYVDRHSPAYKAGIEAGQTLVKIDGQPAAELGLGEVRRLLSSEGGKATHDLTVIGYQGGTGTYKVSLYDPLP